MNFFKKTLPILLLAAFQLQAQTTLPIPRNIRSTFEKGTRSLTGQPGEKYWQNFATYDLHINFTPKTRLISGTADIVYTNNSPDTLREIHFKLYPNLYKKGSPRLSLFHSEDTGDGMSIEKITLNGQVQDAGAARVQGTEMDVRIQPLLPGSQVRFSIDFSYVLNKGSHQRTGEIEDGAYFIAYFFPRIAVYDDVDGWNTNPYLGSQEFYNDFCNFKADITVPDGYVVWATGDLKNCAEVLNPTCCQRLAAAETKDGFINIIDSMDLKKGGITANHPTNTFRFEAEGVTDFVFAMSNHYMWQSTSLVVDKTTGRRTRVDAVFNPKHRDYFRVLGDARATVEAMSYRFPKWPFPYPHETVFDGLDQMEYPMMVNDNPVEDVAESIELTDHEIFHTMFPFYMGINETKYGWMDEGWATLGEWLISPMIDPSIVDDYGVERYEQSAGTEEDLPIVTLTTQLTGMPFFTNSYPKPAMGYLFVKDMLGDELFTKALHHYIGTWHGKHPLPWDFFNCMNTGAGRDMDWFWKAWFFDGGVPDLAISKVEKKKITITSKGTKPVPIDLTVEYADGSTEEIHRSIAVWEKGTRSVDVPFLPKKEVVKITLGNVHVPDVEQGDNVWEKSKN
ncbi:MAG: M1 family metallopeptidase [Lewinellaceae bacterium]|nr:M1 family metallopeptidase [Saprospiraceae bacterium]MCB9341936.1 M1 family metallopeptidase [Lewinellaceae bacterium]